MIHFPTQTVDDGVNQTIMLLFSVIMIQADTVHIIMVMDRVCMKGEEALIHVPPTVNDTKNVLPSAQSGSWSGDANALRFLCRKLANGLIKFLYGAFYQE